MTVLDKIEIWCSRTILVLVAFFQISIISVSASPINLGQDHHIGSSDTYTYDETENSISAEVDRTGRLSRVLSKEKVGSDGEVLGAVARVAARGGTKLLTQFSKSTIDDAVSLTMRQKGTHIFANRLHPKPWLNDLATQMGGQRNVINAALQNANGRIIPNASGVFNTPVTVGGVNFTIRGFVNQGTPIINSIFIP